MSLPKSQRLKSRTSINNLFTDRKQARIKLLKIIYKFIDKPENEHPFLFTVTVPKKLIKTAVHRNLIKRRIRASFRLNQDLLQVYLTGNNQIQIMIVYMTNHISDYKTINENVISLLNKIK